ncbi:MAG: hypothetical protein ACD_58C00185G0001 [uncultured bacterium]|nr:MAG: hypothetical protein ACD_58C00185G0001 [uncultured bacterium]
MSRCSRVRFTVSSSGACTNSLTDRGGRKNSYLRPVKGSLILLASSNDDDPVATICISGNVSTNSFSDKPILVTRWASSSKTNLLFPINPFIALLVALVKAARISGSSQDKYIEVVEEVLGSCCIRVVFPA